MAAASALERIKQLDLERAKLMDEAKASALASAETAVAELNTLGFSYRLVQGGSSTATRAPRTPSSSRRGGVREQVLEAIKASSPDGIGRADLLGKLEAKGDTKAEQSISNALSALKKAGTVDATNGQYRIA